MDLKGKKLVLFELDDVLYPKRDFLLQIFYLFGQFVEYTEAKPIARQIVDFMKTEFEKNGEERTLAKTHKKFSLTSDYTENYERLKANGHLPVKLLLFDHIKKLFHDLTTSNIRFAILTQGNPVLQLNKLKHIDWEGWDKDIKIYFADELNFKNINAINYIAQDFQINQDEIVLFNNENCN